MQRSNLVSSAPRPHLDWKKKENEQAKNGSKQERWALLILVLCYRALI